MRWFVQILAAARETDRDLFIDNETGWKGVGTDLRNDLSAPQNWLDADEIVRLRAADARRTPASNLARFLDIKSH